MSEAGWAEQQVDGIARWQGGLRDDVIELLLAEHARAVRIVKAEIKRVKLDDYSHTEETRKMILYSLNKLLTALQRGRGGKG